MQALLTEPGAVVVLGPRSGERPDEPMPSGARTAVISLMNKRLPIWQMHS